MAEGADEDILARTPQGAGDNTAAITLAVSHASREKADSFLDRHAALVELQIENLRLSNEQLRAQDAFEMSHLRWRRFNDQMKGAMQIMIVLVGALIVIGIGAALWNASQADGLVVDSFTAPPGFAAPGIGGDVIATDLTNRLTAIRAIAMAHSVSTASAVSQSNADEVKVEIPETGISLAEAGRFLRGWLGHEQHVSGSLRQLLDGTVSLRAQLGGDVVSASGPPANLDKLEQDVAEQIFARVDPISDVRYLTATGRGADALKQAADNALAAQTRESGRAYVLWSYTTFVIAGDIPLAIARMKIGIALFPAYVIGHWVMSIEESTLGHDEIALAEARAALAQSEAAQPKSVQGAGFTAVRSQSQEYVAAFLGNYARAERAACGDTCLPNGLDEAALYAARRHDGSDARRLIGQAQAAGHVDPLSADDARYWAAVASGDWSAAVTAAKARPKADAEDEPREDAALLAVDDETTTRPLLARALAEEGDFAKANAVIATTPPDCYDCARARGLIDALQHYWGGAAYWFADAVKQAPSIPFADTDWGRMLLQKGDLDGAITKFETAHKKGPHFADPLEGWGEVLIAKNRSDLALAKFAQADKYAPRWGRLHLKWGEALLWSGKPDEAQKQFAIAAGLDLTPAERSELAHAGRRL